MTEQESASVSTEYYLRAEVAELCSVDPKTVSRWRENGLLPASEVVSGEMHFEKAPVDALVAQASYAGHNLADRITPKQAAAIMGVDFKTLIRWANEGKIAYWCTPGGNRRYDRKQLRQMREESASSSK